MPDWVPTVAMGHDKVKSPQSDKKRHDRSEKRESTKKATDAAQSLLLLQDDEDSASSGITEEGSASEETQTDVDGLLMECMTSELQQLRMENIALKQKDSSISQLTLTDLEGKDERVRYLTGLSSFAVFSELFNFLLPYIYAKEESNDCISNVTDDTDAFMSEYGGTVFSIRVLCIADNSESDIY